MYTAVFVAPGQGTAAPLAAGLALLAALSTGDGWVGGFYTGGSPLNPARVIANMIVYRCNISWGWSYLLAQLAAIGAAVAWVWPVHGLGMYMGGPRPDAFTGAGTQLGTPGLTDPLLGGGRGGAASGDPAGSSAYA
ncbi:hypothetical protein VOLCADRAFT_96845 [Volvox carteri f. nagariensis]|uniref:Aquaporin n=1 Tax=Volvox carteri f. nagariensis TaxID=3068 RepID=D8UB77_VOLCA|nr:uncharacterized protein VOLCADRAFT_96845 [Volvox carteri f. nagariensis]EFJ43062.1 hypothetical protein VOLCADRAFT_96845 [Volvox carteri f. nagariensis]|eukprot:XP_002955861.1 hypothetical protein VOLCADRAFT_96845 [Volvox carteri f. nagariensis]